MTKGKGKAPGAGGLDKHIKRKAKQERSQLEARKGLGALEKHKDYVVRSKRRHKKVEKLQQAKRAAAQRNPDEFNIAMTKMVVDMGTGKVKRRPASKEEKREGRMAAMTANSANINYLRHRAASDVRRVEELSGEVFGLDMPAQNTHTIFVDADEDLKTVDVTQRLNTTRDMLQYPAIRPNLARLGTLVLDSSGTVEEERRLTRRQRAQIAKQLRGAVPRADRSEADDGADDLELHGGATAEEQAVGGAGAGQLILGREEEESDRRPAAAKFRELQQRARRASTLRQLAQTVAQQNEKMHKSLHARRNSRFVKGAKVRQR